MQLTVSAKVFFWNGERFFFWLKFWRKFMYTCLNLHCKYLYLLFFMYVSFCKNYWVIFRESLAKALAKDGLPSKARWPKLWTCCVGTGRWRWARTNIFKAERKCLSAAAAEWSVTRDQRPGTYLRIMILHIHVLLKNLGQHVPRKINVEFAKVRRKNFFLAKMAFSRWKNLEQPSHFVCMGACLRLSFVIILLVYVLACWSLCLPLLSLRAKSSTGLTSRNHNAALFNLV